MDAWDKQAASGCAWSEKTADRSADVPAANDVSDATDTKWFIQNKISTNSDMEKNNSNETWARIAL